MTADGSKLSDIAVRQNGDACQRLLKARQWRWAVAVRWQLAQIALVLAAPIVAVTLGLAVPEAKPFIAFLAVCLTLLDVTLVDRAYKTALKTAARSSELFDIQLLKLEWHGLVAGMRPTPEETDSAVRGWERLRTKHSIENWYALDVDKVPMGLARAICQRTNVTYDSDLRRLYRIWLDSLMVGVTVIIVFLGMASQATFADFVLSAVVPTAPFLIWGLRERFRQADAVKANEPVTQEAEKLIEAVIAGNCPDHDCLIRSRSLQDAIFQRRATTVLLFPGIYRYRRPDAERDMLAGAAHWVGKAIEQA